VPKGYRPYLPDQDLLLPPNPREWVAEEHLVYFVSDVVDQLDLSAIQAVYGEENRRQPPYDPRLMTKLLYGYSMGLFGVQRMAQRNVIIRHLPGCRNFGFGKQNLPRRNWHLPLPSNQLTTLRARVAQSKIKSWKTESRRRESGFETHWSEPPYFATIQSLVKADE